MSERAVSIGNATYNVSRKFAEKRTIHDAIRESIAARATSGRRQGKFTTHPQPTAASQPPQNLLQ